MNPSQTKVGMRPPKPLDFALGPELVEWAMSEIGIGRGARGERKSVSALPYTFPVLFMILRG
jgi:hypothetical protein